MIIFSAFVFIFSRLSRCFLPVSFVNFRITLLKEKYEVTIQHITRIHCRKAVLSIKYVLLSAATAKHTAHDEKKACMKSRTEEMAIPNVRIEENIMRYGMMQMLKKV